jgi:DNA-binding response OmpR family regulator
MATLLVVDDDPEQLVMRARVLEREGYKVRSATDVAGALMHREFDLVLMDLRLPTVQDGMNLIASIGSRAPIIVLTGAPVDDLPVARVLRKPCRTQAILESIAELLA